MTISALIHIAASSIILLFFYGWVVFHCIYGYSHLKWVISFSQAKNGSSWYYIPNNRTWCSLQIPVCSSHLPRHCLKASHFGPEVLFLLTSPCSQVMKWRPGREGSCFCSAEAQQRRHMNPGPLPVWASPLLPYLSSLSFSLFPCSLLFLPSLPLSPFLFFFFFTLP